MVKKNNSSQDLSSEICNISLSKKIPWESIRCYTPQKSGYGRSSKRGQRTISKFWSSAQLWTEYSNFCFAYLWNIQPSLRRPLPCTAGSSNLWKEHKLVSSCQIDHRLFFLLPYEWNKNTNEKNKSWSRLNSGLSTTELEIVEKICFYFTVHKCNGGEIDQKWTLGELEINRRVAIFYRFSVNKRRLGAFSTFFQRFLSYWLTFTVGFRNFQMKILILQESENEEFSFHFGPV